MAMGVCHALGSSGTGPRPIATSRARTIGAEYGPTREASPAVSAAAGALTGMAAALMKQSFAVTSQVRENKLKSG
jgi:hypothetical protein